MPRNGHVDRLPHGPDLGARVEYRLSGITPVPDRMSPDQRAQIDYRIGDHQVDSRAVWFLGTGPTADHLRYRPGDRVTPADEVVVRAAMFGIDPNTGQRNRVRMVRNPHARIPAAPYWSVIAEACATAGIDPLTLHSGRDLSAQVRSLARHANRPRGTVAFATAEAILRTNEVAWERHDSARRGDPEAPEPVVRFERTGVMQRLGAHHREAQADTGYTGPLLDLALDDHALGRQVWDRVRDASALRFPSGNAGYEITYTCPKSLSVAAFTTPNTSPGQWLELVRDASRAATDALMARVGHGRTGHEGDGQRATLVRGLGYAATVSVEAHSRALDPHLHGHVMIANRIICADGVERTIGSGGADLINHAWWAQAEFERHLRRLSLGRGLVPGWEFDLVDRQWEVAGADPEIMAFASQGQALVHAETRAELGALGTAVTPAEARSADVRAKRKVTASKTDTLLTWQQIRDHLHTRATTAGIDLGNAFTRPPADPATQPGQWTTRIWGRAVEDEVCQTKSAETSARIEAAVRCWAPHDWTDQQIRDTTTTVKAAEFTPGILAPRGRIGARLNASNRVARAETQAMEAFIAGFGANTHRLSPEQAAAGLHRFLTDTGWTARGLDLTLGQRALFDQMTTGPDRISTVVGAAGSGKTTAIDAARVALSAAGQRVYGICVAALAAQQLRDAARVQAGTVTWLNARIDYATNPANPVRAHTTRLAASRDRHDRRRAAAIAARYAIPEMDHLVIDEASMIDAPALATVLNWATTNDVTVTMIGDTKQLQPVGPSAMFTRLHGHHPGAELTENLRQRTDVGRDCARFLRDGDPEAALLRLADAGQFVVATSQTQVEQILVDHWATHAAEAPTVRERVLQYAIESDRNDQVDALNTRAREEARRRGWVTGPDTSYTAGGKSVDYAVGDQILVTRNIPRRDRDRLANGARGIITAVRPEAVALTYWDDQGEHHDTITARQAITCARHGYATTTHKLQGQTVTSLAVDVGPERDLSSAYVALTRHTSEVLAVVNIHDLADAIETDAITDLSPDSLRDAVTTRLARDITRRGFGRPITAHDALGRGLVEPTPSRDWIGLRLTRT